MRATFKKRASEDPAHSQNQAIHLGALGIEAKSIERAKDKVSASRHRKPPDIPNAADIKAQA